MKPVTVLINKSFTQAIVPEIWKQAKVVPVCKGAGDRSAANKYRPISIFPTLSEVLYRENSVRSSDVSF